MPLNSQQLAALVERARHKAPPVVSPPLPPASSQRSVRPSQVPPAPQAPSAMRPPETLPHGQKVACTAVSANPRSEKAAERAVSAETTAPDESPWFLDKSSWLFHRRFYAVFRRPMVRGEYSYLLKQIRFGHAEHLGENHWRVTLPGSSRAFAVVATPWRLITILPKNWQPPGPAPRQTVVANSASEAPSADA
jgi:hypothetical protein